MMFDSNSEICVTFKMNQPMFVVFRRKYLHDFRSNVKH
jgi:hypothetical protein